MFYAAISSGKSDLFFVGFAWIEHGKNLGEGQEDAWREAGEEGVAAWSQTGR